MQSQKWIVPELLSALAHDALNERERYADSFQQQMLIQRRTEAKTLQIRIDENMLFGGNVLLVGDPGTGKSTFIDWFLTGIGLKAKTRSTISRLDLRTCGMGGQQETFIFQTRVELTKAIRKFLIENNLDQCHDIPLPTELTPVSAPGAYLRYTEKLGNVNVQPATPKLQLFVDDIDYIDREYFPEFLWHLRPFLSSRSTCVILAARWPAYNAIIGDGDFMIGKFFHQRPSTVELAHLDAYELLLARFRAILQPGESDTSEGFLKARTVFARVVSALTSLFRTGVSFQDLGDVGLPFTDRQLGYIQEVSNGNILSMLAIARHYLEYMADHKNDLSSDEEGRPVIGRKRLIEDFSNEGKYGQFRIYNLHSRSSPTKKPRGRNNSHRKTFNNRENGNSLHILILECLNEFESLNSANKRWILGCGFSQQDFDEAIKELYNWEMIEEKYIIDQRGIGAQSTYVRDYILTRKGRYYITWIVHWDEYIVHFGCSRHNREGYGPNANEMLRTTLMQFLAALGSLWATTASRTKVSKTAFVEAFNDQAKELLVWANRDDKIHPVEVSLERTSELLLELEVVRQRNIEDFDSYVIEFDKVRSQCLKRRIRFEIWPPFFLRKIDDFVVTHFRTLEEDTRRLL